MAVVKECLENNIKWQKEYGPKTIVLTAIGSFLENYTLVNDDESYTSSVFQDFVGICDLMVGKKNVFIDGKQLLMAGFGLAQLDKYVRKLQEHDYTIVIYKQDVNGKNTTRSLSEIISPGTFFGQETLALSNNIMCIWLHSNGRQMGSNSACGRRGGGTSNGEGSNSACGRRRGGTSNGEGSNSACGRRGEGTSNGEGSTSKYFTGGKAPRPPTASGIVAIGVATIDIFTGKTSLFQFSVDYNHNPLTYDELERYVSVYKPSECLFVNSGSNSGSNSACGRQAQQMGSAPSAIATPPATASGIANDIISYIGLDTCRKIHKVDLTQQVQAQTTVVKCALNAEKQNYQKEVLTRFYPTMTDTTLMESFSTHSIATQSFCFLLDFVYQHSPNLVRKLSLPIYENYTDKLVLANHSLRQLNIIDDDRHTGKLRSVSSLLNNCVTSMGKRVFMYNLNNPTTNIEVLNDSYDITEHLLKVNTWQTIRKELSTIKDIEKLGRKLIMGKIVPKDFALLAYDLHVIADLFNKLKDDTVLNQYINKYHNNSSTIREQCNEIIADLERTFLLDRIMQVNDEIDELVFIKKGISSKVDALSADSIDSRDKLEAIRAYFSDIVKSKEKATKEKETEYIKIHSPAKSNSVLMGTSRRVTLLKSELKKKTVPSVEVRFTTKKMTFDLYIEDLTYDTVGTNVTVSSPQIIEITNSVYNSKDKLVDELLLFFGNYVNEFSLKFETHLEEIKNYISLLDLLQCKCYIAHTYNYCKPAIPSAIPSAIPLAVGKTGRDAPSGIADGIAPLPPTTSGIAPLPPTTSGIAPLPPTTSGIAPFINFTGIRHPLIEHIQTNELYVTNDLHIGSSISISTFKSAGGIAPSPPTASGIAGIRHPLIEHIQTNELYVTNDLYIGGDVPMALSSLSHKNSQGGNAPLPPTASGIADGIASGILLFGTNAVGKTSFIKSVGIALIMAQAGLYVPCTTFNYKPYSYIFTRILGNDNLFKGLSTFAAEMSELRTILLQANENSLVLGDELCSGTESDSALSIFTAGLEHLHENKSTFLFATHFHEIVKYDEIKALDRLQMKHMAVKYDIEHGVLVYDRKLQDGPGDCMYGLEVCKSLSLPDAFLQRAHDIRMKYNKTKQNMLSLDSSHFNAKKIVGNCEFCKDEKASEVHHLQHQKFAKDSNNYIGSFHKNHPANLLNICESCHKKIHSTNNQHMVKKTSEGTYVLIRM